MAEEAFKISAGVTRTIFRTKKKGREGEILKAHLTIKKETSCSSVECLVYMCRISVLDLHIILKHYVACLFYS